MQETLLNIAFLSSIQDQLQQKLAFLIMMFHSWKKRFARYEEIGKFSAIIDQYEFRKETIFETLDEEGINISKLTCCLWSRWFASSDRRRNICCNEEMLS